MQKQVKRVELNLPQLIMALAPQKLKWFEGGRGVGKSTILAWLIKEMAMGMPRGKFFLVGTTFRDILGVTLPSTIEGLELFGMVKGVHYHIGTDKGARKLGWNEPFQAPNDYTTCIHFYTGAVFQLMSQDKGSTPRRGLNFDGGLGDEAALLDEERYANDCVYATRTNRGAFKGHPMYLSRTLVSSTPRTRSGLWFLKGEQLAIEDPTRHLFLRADARQNAHNLAPDWFETARRESPSEAHYNAEVLNMRPRLVLQGYYPALDPARHYYSALDGDYFVHRFADGQPLTADSRADRDCDPNRPLIVDVDPGAAINAVVVKQMAGMELRSLKAMHCLSPMLVQELFEHQFVPYYQHHRRKVVELFYDRTANNRKADDRKTTAERIREVLERAGWRVVMRSQASATIYQDQKYYLLAAAMREEDPRLPRIRINRDNCRDLIISLENAEARENTKGRIEKDKRSERRMGSVPRQHATDYSDAFDLSTWYYCRVAERGQAEFHDVMAM